MKLPDIEIVAAAVHQEWMDNKLAQGITSRPAEDGEEQMVPYAQLSERAKQQDRVTVQAVYRAIEAAAKQGDE
jgi:RyR domain